MAMGLRGQGGSKRNLVSLHSKEMPRKNILSSLYLMGI
jgi:hypothetical protein